MFIRLYVVIQVYLQMSCICSTNNIINNITMVYQYELSSETRISDKLIYIRNLIKKSQICRISH